MKHRAAPFDALLGLVPTRAPRSEERCTLVVAGRRVTTARDIPPTDEVEAVIAEKLRRKLKAERDRARYQRDRKNPEAMAKRQAWLDANADERKAYQKAYRETNRERIAETRAEWAKRDYHAQPEKHRQKQREYYARHRDAILARLKAKREAAKGGA